MTNLACSASAIRRGFRALAVVLGFVFVGCANTSGQNGGDGPGSHDMACHGANCPNQCMSDADCRNNANGTRCSPQRHACVPCLTDGDCPSGQLCNPVTNVCAAGCSANRGCAPDGGICDHDAGMCVQCDVDADCHDKTAPRCDPMQHACFPCIPQKDNCGHAEYCAMQGGGYSCMPGCKNDGDCNAVDGGVAPDGGAGGSSFCDPTSHQCVHCKANKDCALGQVCMSGNCVDGCAADHGCAGALTCCTPACVDTTTSTQNCGTCGNGCSGGWMCCKSACANPAADVLNCGSCGNACTPANATGQCVNRLCAIKKCDPGFGDCDGNYMDGCETDLTMSINNCGMCGKACSILHALPSCVAGACAINTCLDGWGDCDQLLTNGCELPIKGSDLGNCGGCGTICTIAHGAPMCNQGQCQIASCNQGFKDCNNIATDGCEVDLTSDPGNCGACGNKCPAINGTASCVNSSCRITCDPGYKDCDGNITNGCEVNTTNDPNNCNGCNVRCVLSNAIAGCARSSCVVSSCLGNYRDCDNIALNGCEADITSDSSNCGICGNICPGLNNGTDDYGCSNSSCYFTCRGENYDVDNNPNNGCEITDGDPNGHTQGSATYLGSYGACDQSLGFAGVIPSDSRVHANPPLASFDGNVGAAPDWWYVFGTGAGVFCYNDYGVTFATTGGGGTPCYRATIITNRGQQSVTVTGNGSATMQGGSGSYSNNTNIYFLIQKICSLPIQENVSYSVNFHI